MKVYVYKEFCDSEAYGEEIIKVYASKEDALKKLRNRVEEYCECPFEDIPTKFDLDDDDLTLREDYVSMYVGKGYAFWIVEEKTVTPDSRTVPRLVSEESKWIPTAKRLPKEHICADGYVEPSDMVFIKTVSGNVTVSRYWGNRQSKITEEAEERGPEYYDWVEAELWEDDVVEWMPFPE